MSIETQFNAAVNVIQSLPKNGPFQPSYAMMQTFYGFYKQATQGDCNVSKPSFWDVVGKAKYEAWKKLAGMSKEEAMKNYVEELKKIVETMSFSADVATFTEVLGPFYEFVADEVADNLGKNEGIKKVEDFEQNTNPELNFSHKNQSLTTAELNKVLGKYDSGHMDATSNTTDEDRRSLSEEEDFLDVQEEPNQILSNLVDQTQEEKMVIEVLQTAIKTLNNDVHSINSKLCHLEKAILGQKKNKMSFWPLQGFSNSSLFFILFWPFAAQAIISILTMRRR